MRFRIRKIAAATATGFALMAVPAAAQYSQDGGYWAQSSASQPPADQWVPYQQTNQYQPAPQYQPTAQYQSAQYDSAAYQTGASPAYTAPAAAQYAAAEQYPSYQSSNQTPQYPSHSLGGAYSSLDPYAAYRAPLWQQARVDQPTVIPESNPYQESLAPLPAPAVAGPGDARIHALENELAALKARLDATPLEAPPGFYDTAPCATGACATGDCAPMACQPCCTGGFYGGVEFLWIKPRFRDCTVIIVDPAASNNGHCADYDYEFTPRVWAGYQNCDGLGARFTYWQFDHSMGSMSEMGTAGAFPVYVEVFGANTSFTRSAFAGVGETLTVNHDLDLLTTDFEVTQAFNWRRASFLFGAGLRYARLDSHFVAKATTAAGIIDELVINDYDFEGFGPTFSMMFSRPFGDTGLGFYTNARTSILFGDTEQDIWEYKGTRPVGEPHVQTDSAGGDESLVIAELGIGLQYSRLLKNGALGFVRGGYEGQIWFDAGNPVNTTNDMVLEGLVLGFGILR